MSEPHPQITPGVEQEEQVAMDPQDGELEELDPYPELHFCQLCRDAHPGGALIPLDWSLDLEALLADVRVSWCSDCAGVHLKVRPVRRVSRGAGSRGGRAGWTSLARRRH